MVAGAGTGKTRVIVERIARLLADGTPKSEILALTFTEKAAQEMLDRVSERLHESYGVEIAIHTFNAFGQLLLREFAVEIGLSSNLVLVGEEGKVVFMREHLDDLGLDYFAPVSRPDGQLGALADYFSELKQQLVTPEAYKKFAQKLPSTDEAERLDRQKHTELAMAYGSYIRLMRAQNTIDYDDQLYLLVELLQERPNIAKQLRNRYRYIMVDEFQDTNPMQSRLIDLLAQDHENVMVVGDDDQSIYGWRGATLANIQEFSQRYPSTKQIALIENFRTTQAILDAAYLLIQNNNPDRLEYINKLDKKLVASRGKGQPPAAYVFPQLEAEIGWIADDITRRIAGGQEPGSIAVLARSRRGVQRMHNTLDVAGLEHTVAGLGEDLYQQLPVLMMVDALKTVWEPANSTALYHTLASKLFRCAPGVLSTAAHQAQYERLPLIAILEKSADKKVQSALNHIKLWHERVHDLPVREMSYRILSDSGLLQGYKSDAQDEDTAHEVFSIGQWFASLTGFERISTTPSVHSYLENFEVLRAEGEILHDDTLNLALNLPSVMTIHKAKGLEWRTVYVIDCAAAAFPYLGGGKSLNVPDELRLAAEADARLNEERRLMYVAATRARDELILTYAERHAGASVRKPSRFITELGLAVQDAPETAATQAGFEKYAQAHNSSPVSLPPTMVENGNVVLSASQAEDYLNCPLNFYYKHVLGVPERPGFQTTVGSLFHDLIQTINEAKRSHTQPPAKATLLKRLKSSWPKSGFSSQKQRQRALEHGLNSFTILYDRLLTESAPVDVESSFRVHIPNSHCVLKGRIDAVMPTENGVEIHDYKTTTSVTTAEKAKQKTTSSLQLTTYAVAWRIMHGEAPTHVSLDYVQTGQIGRVAKQAKSLDAMEAKLAEAAAAILAGTFPEGSKHDHCLHPVNAN